MNSESLFNIKPLLETLLRGDSLSTEQSSAWLNAVIDGRVSPAGIAAVLIALKAKGESADELAAMAAVMRSRCVKIEAPPGTVDTCGTGGDGSGTFNISTAAAFVAAGMGIPVAKHGSRAVSSTTGSSDVLTALGVKIDVSPEVAQRCIREAGIGFLFAPNHHPGLKNAAPVRRELGIRTIFNLLGPLSSPAGTKLQLLGVADPKLCTTLAETLAKLGTERAMVVCGTGPVPRKYLDEVSTFGPTTIMRLHYGTITKLTLTPEVTALDKPLLEELEASDAQASAEIIRAVLSGQPGAARDIVALNAAAAAIVAGKTQDWREGIKLACNSIDSGRARETLEKLIARSNREGGS